MSDPPIRLNDPSAGPALLGARCELGGEALVGGPWIVGGAAEQGWTCEVPGCAATIALAQMRLPEGTSGGAISRADGPTRADLLDRNPFDQVAEDAAKALTGRRDSAGGQ